MKPARHARLLRAAVILILLTLASVVIAAPAQAAAYRYWGYFHQTNGAWTFAQTGPAQSNSSDGAVDGWRFAVADEKSIRTPRTTPTFDALCAGVAKKGNSKRIGVVIDFGRPADSPDGSAPPAPRAACVTVPERATGSDVLVAAGATLRIDKALTCGIDGWPATGCGDPVAKVSAAAASPDTKITIAAPPAKAASAAGTSAIKPATKDSSSSTGLILGGLAAVVLVGALGFAAWRRGREATDD